MSLEGAIKARLDSVAALVAYTSKRTYAVTMPQDSALPAVVFDIVTSVPVHAMGSDAAVLESRVRVSSFADSFSVVRLLDEQVRQALSRYRGTSDSTVIQDILEISMNDIYHPEIEGGRFQRARDFRVFSER